MAVRKHPLALALFMIVNSFGQHLILVVNSGLVGPGARFCRAKRAM
jgi:hypothetical protein